MIRIKLLAWCICAVFFVSCATRGDLHCYAPSRIGWEIEILQPIHQLEAHLEKTEQQQEMNETIANISFLYDAKLALVFQEWISGLTEKEREKQISKQKQWLSERRKQIESAYQEYAGGSLAPFNAGQKSVEVTKKRILEIEKHLQKGKGAL